MRSVEVNYNGMSYTLCENGDIYSNKGKKLKVRPNCDGYAQVTVGVSGKRKGIALHREVAKYFVDNPNNLPEVDHIDRDRMNPSANNLRWVTRQQNIDHSIKGCNHGVFNPNAKLDIPTVLAIRKDYANGMTQREIERKYNVPWSTVHNVVRRFTWKYQY